MSETASADRNVDPANAELGRSMESFIDGIFDSPEDYTLTKAESEMPEFYGTGTRDAFRGFTSEGVWIDAMRVFEDGKTYYQIQIILPSFEVCEMYSPSRSGAEYPIVYKDSLASSPIKDRDALDNAAVVLNLALEDAKKQQ